MHRFIHSFRFALRGLEMVWRAEQNFRIQVVALAMALALAAILRVRAWEWTAILLVGGAVLVLECTNSAVERLADFVQPRLHGYVRDVKDAMAGAVLIASVVAAAIGIIILTPYIVSAIVHQWLG
ncbi:MAG: diacylglycerol kinase [Candidatus Uhrbacteria bacterium]